LIKSSKYGNLQVIDGGAPVFNWHEIRKRKRKGSKTRPHSSPDPSCGREISRGGAIPFPQKNSLPRRPVRRSFSGGGVQISFQDFFQKMFELRPKNTALKRLDMKLYHGSKTRLDYLESRQASRGNVEVPADELLQGIYLSSDYAVAVAMAARPENSVTEINDETHEVTFEHPESFRPDEDIFIYEFDSENISVGNLKKLEHDSWQYVVTDIDQLIPENIETAKARKVMEYYTLINWREDTEENREISHEVRLK